MESSRKKFGTRALGHKIIEILQQGAFLSNTFIGEKVSLPGSFINVRARKLRAHHVMNHGIFTFVPLI